MQSNGVPVLLLMEIQDVKAHNGSFQATFSHLYVNNGIFNLVLDLNCTAKQTAELLDDNRDSLVGSYAIVAQVTELDRPKFTLSGTLAGEESRIEVNSDNTVFLAKANCVELVRLKKMILFDE